MKLWRSMFLCFSVGIGWISVGWSQPVDLELSVSVHAENQAIGVVLQELEQDYGLSFAYNVRDVEPDRIVNLHLKDTPLQKALDQLLAPRSFQYSIDGNQLLLVLAEPYSESEGTNSVPLSVSKKREQSLPLYTLSGMVSTQDGGITLAGVNIYIPELGTGTSTDDGGFYSISLPRDSYQLEFSYMGCQTHRLQVYLDSAKQYHVKLKWRLEQLPAVEVQEDAEAVREVQMSKLEIPMEQVQELPTLLGERDVFRALQFMPGVQGGREGQGGLFVRGGQPDQNLILLDGIPLYRPQHLLGAFSAFNGDALKKVSLLKGGQPARFGGRLSAVMDLQMKEANKERFVGSGHVGLISAGGQVEIPLQKNRSSLLVAGRRFYWDLLVQPLVRNLTDEDKVGYAFHDLSAKMDVEMDRANRLSLSFFWGEDGARTQSEYSSSRIFNGDSIVDFELESLNKVNWGNLGVSGQWKCLVNDKLTAHTTLAYSSYTFDVTNRETEIGEREPLLNDRFSNQVKDLSLSQVWSHYPNIYTNFRAGFNLNYRRFLPQLQTRARNGNVEEVPNRLGILKSVESAVFAEYEFKWGSRWQLNTGLRLGMYDFGNDRFLNAEPRFSIAWQCAENLSLKGSYARTRQNMHLVGHSGLKLPTDFWLPANRNLEPENSDQFALGVVRSLPMELELQVEVYHKRMTDIVNLLPGRSYVSIFQEGIEQYYTEGSLTQGVGQSTGLEFMLRKRKGAFTGWIAYTLAWTQAEFEQINLGNRFWMDHDRRHELSLVGTWKWSPRCKMSAAWTYGSASPYTVPTGKYQVYVPSTGDVETVWITDEKNNRRGRAYHRLDISVEWVQYHEKWESAWVLGLYNAYGRANPFLYDTQVFSADSNQSSLEVHEIRILPLLPSISYRIQFL